MVLAAQFQPDAPVAAGNQYGSHACGLRDISVGQVFRQPVQKLLSVEERVDQNAFILAVRPHVEVGGELVPLLQPLGQLLVGNDVQQALRPCSWSE